MTPPLVKHCEDHLGPIVGGWTVDASGRKLPFQVVLFEGGPIEGSGVLCTLGLSKFPLRVGEAQPRRLRQELLVMFRRSDGARNLPGILQDLGMEALERDIAYALGDVVGPRGELRAGVTVSAFYTALPVYLPDSFQVCRLLPEPIVFAWLVPITEAEAAFARASGRDAMEDLLESADPDLLDFARASVV